MSTTPEQIAHIERQVIGAAMLDASACAQAIALVPADRFLYPEHRRIMGTIERLFSEGVDVSMAALEAAGEDTEWLRSCLFSGGRGDAIEYQATVLNERHIAREARTAMERAMREMTTGGDARAVLGRLQRGISDLLLTGHARADTHIRHAVTEALARTEEWREGEVTDFAPSGFYSLDRLAGGLPIGELTTLAAMTGAGKTSLVCHAVRAIATAEANRGRNFPNRPARPVLVFSAEMSREQIAHRIAAGIAGVNIRDLRDGKLAPGDFDRYDAALGSVASLDIHVDDEPSPSFAHIAARLQQVRQTAETGSLALVAVDYDEKVDAEGDTEELRVSAIARGLKVLAKRYAVPVLALSQYSRSAAAEAWPTNEWLRYSGKKEHESALILHWMWPQYWIGKGKNPEKVAGYRVHKPDSGYLCVTKNRFGPMGKIALDFHPHTTSFTDPGEPAHV